MTKELSALLDGELETHEAPALWSSVQTDKALGRKWSEYQLIRDAIHQEDCLSSDIVARVMNDLESEPTVLAPRAVPRQTRQQRSSMLALAASVAGVAVVGWLAFVPQGGQREAGQIVRAPGPQPPIALAPLPSRVAPGGLANGPSAAPDYRQYLLAHQASAAGLYMQGGAQHIRTVSSLGGGQ